MIKLFRHMGNSFSQIRSSVFIIFFLVILSHLNIFHNQFIMDDLDFIVRWEFIQDLNNFPNFFVNYAPPAGHPGIYSPLKALFHALTYHFFGLEPFGYHIVSLLIHLTGIWLVYHLALYFIKNTSVTFLATLLFALHPVQVEAVTYMTASIDMLGVVFLFAAFYFYIHSREKRKGYYRLSLLFSLLAIFTNELTISLPLLFLWHDHCFGRTQDGKNAVFRRLWPFFAVAFLYVICKYIALGSIARGTYINHSFYFTMLVMVKAFAKYAFICLFPIILTHDHIISPGIYSFAYEDFDQIFVLTQSIFNLHVTVSLLILFFIFDTARKLYKKTPLIPFCIGWFYICLLPVSNIIPSSVYFGERYLYPGLWAVCLIAAYYLVQLTQKKRMFLRLPVVYFVYAFIFLLVSFYAGRTWFRNADYRNEIVYLKAAIKANPNSALLKESLGITYIEKGYPRESIKMFQKALDIRPDVPRTYFNLSRAYGLINERTKAIDVLKKATLLRHDYAQAHYNLAGLYAVENQVDEAQMSLQSAIKFLRQEGRADEARAWGEAFRKRFNY